MTRLFQTCFCLMVAEGAVVALGTRLPPTPPIAVTAPVRVGDLGGSGVADAACMREVYAYARTVTLSRKLDPKAGPLTSDAVDDAREDLLDCLSELDAADDLDMTNRGWAVSEYPDERRSWGPRPQIPSSGSSIIGF